MRMMTRRLDIHTVQMCTKHLFIVYLILCTDHAYKITNPKRKAFINIRDLLSVLLWLQLPKGPILEAFNINPC